MPSKQAVEEVRGFGIVPASDFKMYDWMSHPLSPGEKFANDSTETHTRREWKMN